MKNNCLVWRSGDHMEKKRTIQRNTGKKSGKPKMRFNFWVMVLIFVFSFLACFALYMLAANLNDNFFKDEFNATVAELESRKANEGTTSEASEEQTEEKTDTAITNPVPQSEKADSNYLEESALFTDGTLLGMADNGGFGYVVGNASLNAKNCTTAQADSSFGSGTLTEIAGKMKPKRLYIMLGSDVTTDKTDEMVKSYQELVTSLKNSLPDTKIFVMQLPPVPEGFETVTNEKVNEYNTKLLSMADQAGVYCIDTNTALKSDSGVLSPDYWSIANQNYTSQLYSVLTDYILSHTV